MYSISIIVPIYNVAPFIEKCVRSLMGQTLDNIEYIFVDDASTDNSIEILQKALLEYPQKKDDIRIIRHTQNQGVAAARTSAMRIMSGEYTASCDADDWVEPTMYEKLYNAAKTVDTDIATCRYYKELNDASTIDGVCVNGTGYGVLKSSKFTYGLWDKIIRTSIIQNNDIYPFLNINYNEDLNVIVRALCYSNMVVGIEDPLYHHLESREGSICTSNYYGNVYKNSVPSMKLLDQFLEDFKIKTGDKRFGSFLTNPLKFWMKSGFYASGRYDEWCKLWPESNWFGLKSPSLSLKEKLMMAKIILQHSFS